MKTVFIQLQNDVIEIRVAPDAQVQRQQDDLNIIDKDGTTVGSFKYENVLGWWVINDD